LLSSKAYYINGNSVLNSTTLGSGVTASSLTSVGTLSTGTWSASTIAVNKGGTGQTTYTNGQLLIGNTTGNTLSKATLTAGSNVTITNGTGSITINAAATNLSATAGTTAGPVINSSTGTNVTIPSASSTASGIVTTGTQTFAGAKTFNTGTLSALTFNATSTTNGGFQGIDDDTITAPSFTWTSDQNTGMWHAGTDQIGFTTAGVNRLTISTTAITSTLPITANVTGNVTGSSGSTTGNAATATKLATARAIAVSGAVTGTANFDGSGNISIATTATSDPVITLTGAVTGAGTMTNLGSVSIATTATADPTLTLAGDASGSATFTNLGNATLTVVVADDSHNHIISNVDGLQTELNSKLPLAGGTMTGQLLCDQPVIARTSDTAGRGLCVTAGPAGNAILQFTNSAISAQWTSLVGTNALLTCTTNFTSSGNITSASDARLKENVVTIDSALNKVEQMRGVYFNKIDDETKTRNVGVIAQEMEEVLPEVVHTREDGMKSVAYANIVGVLIEAIKELKAEIDILKANK
jgi:hypothetical protein